MKFILVDNMFPDNTSVIKAGDISLELWNKDVRQYTLLAYDKNMKTTEIQLIANLSLLRDYVVQLERRIDHE